MANAATFTSADGFSQTFPLEWLYERNAMIAICVGGEPIERSFGGINQLWIEGAAARLFVRDITSVEFCTVENPQPPSFEADEMLFKNRPNAGVRCLDDDGRGLADAKPRPLGKPVRFEGYAYDFDRAVVAVEFSLDQGGTWTRYPTPEVEAGRLTWWSFDYTPEVPGAYELLVRAVSEGEKVGPVPARYGFEAA